MKARGDQISGEISTLLPIFCFYLNALIPSQGLQATFAELAWRDCLYLLSIGIHYCVFGVLFRIAKF
ncbi:hypothetical protein COLO4_16156 [Corchorus olitorius]|uniref:Uncharacterized protein n=1 Tax=Corchorus olitorius TaxID=93759 RepID=A0A1R3JJ35_9ROSI|nr:hypothetical protein COLO4_16156 [Corchorus olitorius]